MRLTNKEIKAELKQIEKQLTANRKESGKLDKARNMLYQRQYKLEAKLSKFQVGDMIIVSQLTVRDSAREVDLHHLGKRGQVVEVPDRGNAVVKLEDNSRIHVWQKNLKKIVRVKGAHI